MVNWHFSKRHTIIVPIAILVAGKIDCNLLATALVRQIAETETVSHELTKSAVQKASLVEHVAGGRRQL